jgi:hypothetical protein
LIVGLISGLIWCLRCPSGGCSNQQPDGKGNEDCPIKLASWARLLNRRHGE